MFTRKIVSFILLTTVLLAGLYAPVRPTRAQATFTVTNTGDNGPGSLHQAITDANSNPGPDNIVFNIPPSDPFYGFHTGGVFG
jgi:hypothetical protein